MPTALEGVFMIFLSAADIIMVGVLGTAAVAAVSIFTQPRMMLLCLARSISAALTVVTATLYGQNQQYEASDMLRQTLFVSSILLCIAHSILFIHLEDVLYWIGAEESYIVLALEYANLAIIGVFFTSISAVLQGYMLGFGKTGYVMSINIQGNIVNVVSNAVFIFGLGPFPELGVKGAAIGTIIGTLWTLIGSIYLVFKRQEMHWGSFLPTKAYCQKFIPVFAAVFSEQGFERIGMVLYTRMVAELGVIPYAVHAICMNFCDFYYSFAGGLGKASMIMAGHAHGEKNSAKLRMCWQTGIKWSVFFSLIACLVTFFGRDFIFALYAHDADTKALGSMVMILVAVVSFPEAQSLVSAGLLRGVGKTAQVAVYSLISIAILRPIITALILYELDMGLVGAWIALCIDQMIRATCATILFYKYMKKFDYV